MDRAQIPPVDEGYGVPANTRHRLRAGPGYQAAFERGDEVVVEWRDHGDQTRPACSRFLVFDWAAQQKLYPRLGSETWLIPDYMAERIAEQLGSFGEVEAFALEHQIPFRRAALFHR